MSEEDPIKLYPPPASMYLGDSVYISYDGYGYWLTTQNGYADDPRNKIFMEPEVYEAMKAFIEKRVSRVC